MEIQLYVHIPFCLRKCAYCDFTSTDAFPCSPDEYVDMLLREMKSARELLPVRVSAVTLYFGGGTPSLLQPALVDRVVDGAAKWYGLSQEAEITLEANPGTLDEPRCRDFRRAGINRISLGVQSLDDDMLRTLGRVHSSAEAVAAFRSAQKAGFSSIGIDLIHSLPGQTAAMAERDVRHVVALAPTHVSAYGLTVEPGTPFGEQWERGELHLPSEDESVEMFQRVTEMLVLAGYEHYEISNFARSGYRSKHNEGYWRRRSYLGFGAGAHSFLALPGERWGNVDDIAAYVDSVRNGQPVHGERLLLSDADAKSEYMFLGLRLLEGVSCSCFAKEFGIAVDEVFPHIDEDVRAGLLVRENDVLRLHKSAIIMSNLVFRRFV